MTQKVDRHKQECLRTVNVVDRNFGNNPFISVSFSKRNYEALARRYAFWRDIPKHVWLSLKHLQYLSTPIPFSTFSGIDCTVHILSVFESGILYNHLWSVDSRVSSWRYEKSFSDGKLSLVYLNQHSLF